MNVQKMHQSDLVKLMMTGKHQFAMSAWNMDYPDGEDFYILLHGPASGSANFALFERPEYDRLFEQSQKLPDSAERNRLYRAMDRIAFAYMPMVIHLYLLRAALTYPWVKGYRPHPGHQEAWKYLDIDVAERGRRRWIGGEADFGQDRR